MTSAALTGDPWGSANDAGHKFTIWGCPHRRPALTRAARLDRPPQRAAGLALFRDYTAAARGASRASRNGELAGEVGRLAVLAGEAGQVRGGVVEAGDGLVELAARIW